MYICKYPMFLMRNLRSDPFFFSFTKFGVFKQTIAVPDHSVPRQLNSFVYQRNPCFIQFCFILFCLFVFLLMLM